MVLRIQASYSRLTSLLRELIEFKASDLPLVVIDFFLNVVRTHVGKLLD